MVGDGSAEEARNYGEWDRFARRSLLAVNGCADELLTNRHTSHMDDLTAALRSVIRDEVARQLAELRDEQVKPAVAERHDNWLSVTDAAQYLGIQPATLYDWRTDRKGPQAVKVGRLVKYRIEDLVAWLDRQRS
jgi:excisionase family DNA binding protein